MKKYILLLIIPLFFSCNKKETNGSELTSSNGLTYLKKDMSLFSGIAIDSIGEHRVSEITYKNGIKHGKAKYWSSSGKMEAEGRYIDGKKIGVWNEWQWGIWENTKKREKRWVHVEYETYYWSFKSLKKKWWFWVIIIPIILFLAYFTYKSDKRYRERMKKIPRKKIHKIILIAQAINLCSISIYFFVSKLQIGSMWIANKGDISMIGLILITGFITVVGTALTDSLIYSFISYKGKVK